MLANSSNGVVARPKTYEGQVDLTQRRAWFDGEGDPADNAAGQVVDPTQNDQPNEIDWSKIDPNALPADVIKQHPLYQQVLKESIERRQKLKALAEEGDGVKPKQKTPDAISDQQVDTSTENMPAWASVLMQTVGELVKANSEAPLRAAKAEAISQYGFNAEQASFLNGATSEEIKANAAKLAAAFSLPKSSAGNAGSQEATDSLAARLKDRVQARVEPLKQPSIFDAGVQRQHSGGTIR